MERWLDVTPPQTSDLRSEPLIFAGVSGSYKGGRSPAFYARSAISTVVPRPGRDRTEAAPAMLAARWRMFRRP